MNFFTLCLNGSVCIHFIATMEIFLFSVTIELAAYNTVIHIEDCFVYSSIYISTALCVQFTMYLYTYVV